MVQFCILGNIEKTHTAQYNKTIESKGHMTAVCRNSSAAFLNIQSDAGNGVQENAFLHNKYINYLITELKPVTGEIIRQGAAEGLIVCQQPDALAEIVLLVLVVKLDNTLIPSTKEETEQTISELISLLEKGTDNPEGSLNFLRV